MARTWLVIGLGNPGPQYEATRHNVGQLVVDELAARRSERFRMHKVGARVAQTWLRPGADRLVLAKLNCFMNVSGGPIAALAAFYAVPPSQVVIVHDELDIPFGAVRLKSGGGHGGHNGVRDVVKALATPAFARVRVGVGRPPGRQDPADWVLSPFPRTQRDEVATVIADAADAVELLIDEGLTVAQQRFHAPRA